MYLIPPEIYSSIHICVVFVLSVFYSIYIYRSSSDSIFNMQYGYSYGFILYIFCVILFLGFRPIDYSFGDMPGYAATFREMAVSNSISNYLGNEKGEWEWTFLTFFLSKYCSVNFYFFIVAILYIVPVAIALRKLISNFPDISMLFYLGSFSFFAYGTNTIRAGVALSLVCYAFSVFLISCRKRKFIYFFLLCFIAYNIHHSVILPISTFIFSLFFRNTKFAITFWFLALLLSILLGKDLQNLIMSWGFDPRMESYSEDVDYSGFSRSGFRWDFMLYSFMPILLGICLLTKKRIYNDVYCILLNTYIYSNAIWLLINQIKFSDRFAYLSWFLYPVVLAYPLLKIKFSNNQTIWISSVLCCTIGFTLLMNVIYG